MKAKIGQPREKGRECEARVVDTFLSLVYPSTAQSCLDRYGGQKLRWQCTHTHTHTDTWPRETSAAASMVAAAVKDMTFTYCMSQSHRFPSRA